MSDVEDFKDKVIEILEKRLVGNDLLSHTSRNIRESIEEINNLPTVESESELYKCPECEGVNTIPYEGVYIKEFDRHCADCGNNSKSDTKEVKTLPDKVDIENLKELIRYVDPWDNIRTDLRCGEDARDMLDSVKKIIDYIGE